MHDDDDDDDDLGGSLGIFDRQNPAADTTKKRKEEPL
jgi:hypothetical protein